MTKREAIVHSFRQYLDAITIIGGYKNNFPASTHWSTNIEPKENEILINVKDRALNFVDADQSGEEILSVDVFLGCCKTGTNYSTIANLIDDVKHCIFNNRRAMEVALNLTEIKFVSDEIEIAQFEKEVGAGRVSFLITTGQNCNWYHDDTNYS